MRDRNSGARASPRVIVKQDQIDTAVFESFEGRIDRGAVRHHLEVRLGVQQATQALAKQRMVVEQKQTHRRVHSRFRGLRGHARPPLR